MDVVFLAPVYPPEMQQYARGLAEVGARVYGIGDSPAHDLGPVGRYLSDYLAVPRILDEADVLERASRWLKGRHLDRVLTNWEPLVVLAARMRERWGVPGMDVETAIGFRDKVRMKERVAAAGLRVPEAVRAATIAEVLAAVERIGYPLIIKPIAGAGSADTYRIGSEEDLRHIIPRLRHLPEVSIEEFVTGEELTYDTVCIGGEPVYENVTHYFPPPLIARRNEWVSPISVTIRDLARPDIAPGLALGRAVLSALGMDDGFTHMEWFLTPSGEAVFGEIGCRPGGAHLVDQMNYTSDVDLFVEWARAVCWHSFEGNRERHYNTAICFKRARGRGRIQRIEGLDALRRACGAHLVQESLLPIGSPRRNWIHTLLSDGFVIIRHPDFAEAKRLADLAATDLQLYAS